MDAIDSRRAELEAQGLYLTPGLKPVIPEEFIADAGAAALENWLANKGDASPSDAAKCIYKAMGDAARLLMTVNREILFRVVEPGSGKAYAIYCDGRTEGFAEGAQPFNYFRYQVDAARSREDAAQKMVAVYDSYGCDPSVLCVVDLSMLWPVVVRLMTKERDAILASIKRLQVDPACSRSGLCRPEALSPNGLTVQVRPVAAGPE